MTLRRVLILADESAEWIVAGLRQLERLALSIDEFALENKETAPVLVCIFLASGPGSNAEMGSEKRTAGPRGFYH